MLRFAKLRFLLAAAAACSALGVVVAVVRAWRAGGVKSIYSGRASRDKLLAVVVPVYDGDQDDAMRALSKWPETCHDNTLYGMDLVIYKAEDLANADQLPQVPHQASRCFRRTKIIDARLLPEVRPSSSCVLYMQPPRPNSTLVVELLTLNIPTTAKQRPGYLEIFLQWVRG